MYAASIAAARSEGFVRGISLSCCFATDGAVFTVSSTFIDLPSVRFGSTMKIVPKKFDERRTS